MAIPPNPANLPAMSPDAVTELRLKQLEETAIGARATERAVDHLQIAMSRFESLLVKMEQQIKDNDKNSRLSLARLHERLDEIAGGEQREAGAKAERVRLARFVAGLVAANAAVVGMVVGVLTLILK